MRTRTTLWLIAIIGCAALGLWQRQNLSILLREYNALWRDTDYRDGSISYRRPLIPENVAKTDPEAAKIAEHILGRYERDERLLSVSQGILKYPQNEFLLNEFADYIWQESDYDCQIRLETAKRLISLNSQKPQYHYFLADALLACGSDINSILDAVEQGNRCSDYNIPYDKYKKRVVDIAEKAKLSRKQIGYLDCERLESSPYGLDRKLIGFAVAAFADGNNLIGTRICDTVYWMQRKYVQAGDRRAISTNNMSTMASFVYFGNWYNPEGLELQRVKLSKERARENRLRLCSRIHEGVLADSEKSDVGSQNNICDERKTESALIATILAPYFGRMFVSVGLAILILALFCLADGYVKNEKVGLAKTLMFAFACLVFSLVARGVFVHSALGDICCCGSYTEMLHPPRIALNALQNEPVLAVIFLVIPVTGLLLLHISGKSRWWVRAFFLVAVTAGCFVFRGLAEHLKFEQPSFEDMIRPVIIVIVVVFAEIVLAIIARWLGKWRVVWLAVVAPLFGSLSIATWGYFYLEYLVMLLFVTFSAATIVGPSPKDKSPFISLFQLFGTDTQQVANRVKCLKLVAPFIVVYWIIFVGLMPLSAYRINYEAGRERPPRKKYTVLEPNEATYQRVLGYLENTTKTRYGAPRLLGLVMPGDLPDVLKKLKEHPSDEYNLRLSRGSEPNAPRDPNRIYDNLLAGVIVSFGRDVVGIISAAMADPNRPRALLARAKLGDISAKQPLEQLLAQCIADSKDFPRRPDNTGRMDRPLSSAEIIPALACASEPNEAVQRYLSFIQRNDMPGVIDEFSFIRGINLLPTQQAKIVIKAYLAKAADWRTPPEGEMWPNLRGALNSLQEIVGFYADREIAEDVFRLMLRIHENRGELRELNISQYFTIESAELLKKGLIVPNYRFRAWSVWQLRRIGYQFTQEELDKLLKDDSWIVRANAVMAEPERAKDIAVNDKNSFVRFVATLSVDSQ
jgi:hypothetical protein